MKLLILVSLFYVPISLAQTELINVNPDVTEDVRDAITYDSYTHRQEQEAPPESSIASDFSYEEGAAEYSDGGQEYDSRPLDEEVYY